MVDTVRPVIGPSAATAQACLPNPHNDEPCERPQVQLPSVRRGVWGFEPQFSPLVAGLEAPPRQRFNVEDEPIIEPPTHVLTKHNLIENRADPGRAEPGFLPYTDPKHVDRPIDLSKPALVLVHGMFGNLDRMTDLAARAHAAGHQVFFYKYDTGDQDPADSSRELAGFLTKLHGLYALGGHAGQTLDVISHSMGGPVTRGAFNVLQAETPAAGFSDVRLLAVDAPWSGVDLGAVPGALAGDAAVGLAKDGEFYADLYATDLTGVTIHSINARRDKFFEIAGRFVDSLYEINPRDLRPVVDAVLAGAPPAAEASPEARNVHGYLAQDHAFAALATELRTRLAGDFTDQEAAEALQKAAEGCGFFADGHHNSILDDRKTEDDVVDRALVFLKRDD